jgi:hypothetical protein
MDKINQIPIIIHSMDSYSKFWNPCHSQLKKYLHNHGKILFLSEEKEPDFVNEITHIKTGKGEWGERLLTALEQINDDLVFYMQEDFWAKSELILTDDLLYLFKKYNMSQLHIKNKINGMGLIYDKINHNLYKMGQHSTYTQNHQFALWDKEKLKSNILPNENPWENEINGTKRINKTPHNIFLLEHDWYDTTCTKGEINQRGIDLILKEKINF